MASRGKQIVQLALEKVKSPKTCQDLNNNSVCTYRSQGANIVDLTKMLTCEEQLQTKCSDQDSSSENTKCIEKCKQLKSVKCLKIQTQII